MKTTYEYDYYIEKYGLDALMRKLNELGDVRWEVIQIQFEPKGLYGTYTAYLKRTH